MKRMLLRTTTASVIAASAFCVSMPTALAQDESSGASSSSDVVITVGTRRGARSAADTPAPVDVIGSDELLNQGDTDIQNILRTSVPSYNVNTQPISDAATLIRPANLRGLPPDSTLVLVNNKRRHRAAVITFLGGGLSDGSQGPDISVIPSIALKQVEVLRDGASSQYGSDAIAGVINFVLKDAPDGASFEAEWGQTYEGDGDQYSISANLGLPIPVGQGGFFNISGEYGEIDATSRSVQRDDAAALIAAGNTAVANPAQIWGQPNVNDDFTIFANMAVPFSEAIEMYTFGNYAEREVEGGFFFRNPNTRPGVFSNDGGASLLVGDLTADGSGMCPTITITDNVPDPVALAAVSADPDCFVFNELFPGGFTPRFGGNLEDKSVVGGFRGLLGRLSYDLSVTYGQNDINFFINNTVNASLGPNTPTEFRPGGYTQKDLNFNADFAYAIPNDMFASDIVLAMGFEHREEEFTIRAGDPASFQIGPLAAPSMAYPGGQGFSSSSNGFGGFTPASAGTTSQKNYAIYTEVETDITDQFTLQGAVRYEDFYDSFGDTINYKVGALFKLNEGVTLRSTYSTGFHAPTAGQANVTNITTQFSGGQLQDQGTLPLSSAAGQFIADQLEVATGSRPTLGPEESKNFTAGVGFGLGNFDITVDYFRIKVTDRIAISDQQDFRGALFAAGLDAGLSAADMGVTADVNGDMMINSDDGITSVILFSLDANGILNASDFAGSEDLTSFGFFQNAFDTRTQGIDIVASTDFELYQGSSTNMALAFNWTDTKVTDLGLDTAAPLSTGRARQIEDSTPAVRGNMTFNHYQGIFRGLARVNFYGKFFECHLDAVNNGPFPSCDLPHNGSAQVTVDLEAGLEIVEGVEIIAGVQNVFDSYPDALSAANAGVAGSQYPPVAPAGYSGGLYYFRLRADL
ncbi:TonB-dependent receptor [Hyphococcus formosus]|uniref:TonB-dependent receptor plug domain-containing protein n=1 Tax=Hyphococcus formosus TaxID=3143534 RepID=UPI00398AFB5C